MESGLVSFPVLISPDNGLWRDHAKCKAMGNEMFFDYGKGRGKDAIKNLARVARFCSDCPVRKECLRFALDNNIKYGVWGGMSPNQRKSFRNGSDKVV